MFGMSLGEILIIAVIAILFIGPEKLPDALVKIAKFFKSFKKSINDAKETFDKELEISELKESAITYKKQLEKSIDDVKENSHLSKLDDIYSEFNSLSSELDDTIKDKPKKKAKKKAKKITKKVEKDA